MQFIELQQSDFDDPQTNGFGAVVDVAFKKINKSYITFLIWRVENMSLVAVPKDQYGIFYNTDSYVIYGASIPGQSVGTDTVTKEVKATTLEYHIHFWLGSNTSPDKSGTAAYKTVELDKCVNETATQYRETQGNESLRFKSYFKNGIKVLSTETSLQNLPVLYKVKGNCVPALIQLNSVSWDKLNSSDVFLVHTDKILFIWIGRAVEASDKLNAVKFATELKEQNNIPCVSFVDDGYEKTLPDEDRKEWTKHFPLEKRMVFQDNEDFSTNQRSKNIKLYKCSENNGKYRVAEIKTGPLYQTDLQGEDVYIIDHEHNGVWIWVGRRASEKERAEALRNARGFVKKKKYPNNTKVTRVVDTFEPSEFKSLFPHWKNENKVKPKIMLMTKFDAASMDDRANLAAETQLLDDGSGHATVWRIKQNSLIEIQQERQNCFFSGDCYIVLYSYQLSEEKRVLYYWLGAHATQEEINTTNLKVMEIDERLGGVLFQCRIIQEREPAHFLQIFKGKLTVFKGRGTDFDDSGRNLKQPHQYFLQVFGSALSSTKAMQIQPRASYLNSNICYVLKRGKHAHIWCGQYTTGDQKEMAKLFAGKDFELILENREKAEFYDFLGGKTLYTTQLIKNESDVRPARLIKCTKAKTGKTEEILFFQQKDLQPENIMLVDFFNVIYLWVGSLTSKEDQRRSLEIVLNYLQTDPSNRDVNVAITILHQGNEPATFTGFFPSWNKKFWKNYKSFTKTRDDLDLNKRKINGKVTMGHQMESGHSDFDQFEKYPIEVLKEPNEKLPNKVDPLNKELHLTHDDFVTILKMHYSDFEKLPRWKQQELKKKNGLF